MKITFKKIVKRFYIKLATELKKYETVVAARSLPGFGNNPVNLTIEMPRKIFNPDRIFIGDNVSLGPDSFLNPMTEYPTGWMRHPDIEQEHQRFEPEIIIGDNVTATAGLQVTAFERVTIGDDVMFASNVHINDGSHGYSNAGLPFKYQPIGNISPISIGRGAWIGQNAVIMPGVSVGELSIIGANSVVTRSIPEKSVAVGNPARVIRSLDS